MSISKKWSKRLLDDKWTTYRRLLCYCKPYTGRLALGIFCGAVFGGSLGGILVYMGKMLNAFGSERSPRLVFLGIVISIFGITRGVGQFLSEYLMAWVGYRTVMDIRNEVFCRLQDLSVRFFTRSRTGELISRTINDSALVEQSVSKALKDVAKQPFTLVAALAVLLYKDAFLALLCFLLFPLCILPIALFGRRVRRSARSAQARLSDLTSILQEAVVGMRVVKAFGMEKYELSRFAAECMRFFKRMMNVAFAKAMIEPVVTFVAILALNMVLVYAHQVHMSINDVIIFAVALLALYEPVKKISRLHIQIQQASAAADRVFEIIDTEVTVCEAPDAVALDGEIGTIAFENVSFRYDSSTEVLRGVSLSVSKGESIAIVGGSGAGKTTLVNLIPRFYDPDEGRLAINGEDVRGYTLRSLRSRIGIVTQETFLFNDTVANNIAYGHTEASRDAVIEASQRANAHDFIQRMENGYDTVIGERGVRLSGGQCQRLAIARAILRNPPILVLDEATSALDTESERLVQAAIDELMRGRTVFAIAHRLSTIIHCNKIVVLDHGRIVESGTHAELIEAAGAYKRLYDLQFRDVPAAG